MVTDQRVVTIAGETISIHADTICLHGDGDHAVAFARKINTVLQEHGITIKSK
jgi:5-oxoprolinase (ATP-hydrolysing) subunit A